MKKIVSVILTLALALGLALPAVAEDAIKIGVIGPLTGPAAIYGTAVVNAAKIAAAQEAALKVGAPIALQDFLVNLSFLIITSIVNSLGLVASAAVGVAFSM